MDHKKSGLNFNGEGSANPPPAYTETAIVASSSNNPFADPPLGSQPLVDVSTGFGANDEYPPSDEESVRSVYGSISGINLLSEADTIIIIDDSESMGKYGYWALVERVLRYIGPVVTTYDPDGLSIWMLNGRGPSTPNLADGIAGQGWNNIRRTQEIRDIFDKSTPMGTTPIYDRLEHIVTPYMARLAKGPTRPRPINILVITDGCADDPEGVEELAEEICEMLDDNSAPTNQFGIQFIQIGDMEVATRHIRSTLGNTPEADKLIRKARDELEQSTAWLKNLDDYLVEKSAARGGKISRDIFDTKNANDVRKEGGFNPKGIVSIVVGALSKRHDRMN